MKKWLGGKMAKISLIQFGCLLLLPMVNGIGFEGLPGSFCSTRPHPKDCCMNRNDDCSVPVEGTACYCDDFCDRRQGGDIPDCCPDFYEHCRGQKRPETTTYSWTLPTEPTIPTSPPVERGCWEGSEFYPVGAKIKRRCHDCYCRSINEEEDSLFEFQCDSRVCLIQDDLVRRVNSNPQFFRWSAASYPFFSSMTLDDGYRYRLGTFRPERSVRDQNELHIDPNEILPEHFDARRKWGKLIHEIRDQGNCSGSWAFSTTALAADRIAITTAGTRNFSLSTQQLLACNTDRQKGCNGGHVDRAWWYMRKEGIVAEECYPYEGGKGVEYCEVQPAVPLVDVWECPSGSPERRLYEITPPYRIAPKEAEIQYEIKTRGPVQAIFRVYPDFFMYKNGIYEATLRDDPLYGSYPAGYHSVRILGWGTELSPDGPIKYWLCANSWGAQWGEDGYFRIIRGENEADIESFVIGVWGHKLTEEETVETQRRRLRARRHHRKRRTVHERTLRALRQLQQLLDQD